MHLRRGRKPNNTEAVYSRLLAVLVDAQKMFDKGFDDLLIVDNRRVLEPLPVLQDGIPLLERLIEHVRQRREEQARNLEREIGNIGKMLDDAAATDPD